MMKRFTLDSIDVQKCIDALLADEPGSLVKVLKEIEQKTGKRIYRSKPANKPAKKRVRRGVGSY
jgi:ACT domain-containing protein